MIKIPSVHHNQSTVHHGMIHSVVIAVEVQPFFNRSFGFNLIVLDSLTTHFDQTNTLLLWNLMTYMVIDYWFVLFQCCLYNCSLIRCGKVNGVLRW